MDPYKKYKVSSSISGDPARQLIFIFDEILNLLYRAQKSIGELDLEIKYKALKRVSEVFTQLRAGVDVESGGEVSRLLDNFYAMAVDSANNANLNAQKPEDLDVLIQAIKNVRNSFQEENTYH